MKRKILVASLATTALIAVVGFATAANAYDNIDNTVVVTTSACDDPESLVPTGALSVVYTNVADDGVATTPTFSVMTSHGVLADVQGPIEVLDGESTTRTFNGVWGGDGYVIIDDGTGIPDLPFSMPFCEEPAGPTEGTVVSITETACDMVSTPALEGSALLVVQDIWGDTSDVLVTGLAAGITSGNVDDGTEAGLSVSITISACTEVANPGGGSTGGSTPASTPASSTTANPVVRAKVPDAGTDWIGEGE